MNHIQLYESFQTTLKVYHRTTPEAAAKIMQDGFQAGLGMNYGKGAYFYLDTPKDKDLSGHGSVIVQGEIADLSGFLITDPAWAKRLLGKEADLASQIEKIMGKEWLDTHDIGSILDDPNGMLLIFRLDQGRYERRDSFEKKQEVSVVGKELKGWIRSHEEPGSEATWCICYDPTRVRPVTIL
jgi:hypothetical protein